MYAPGDGTIYCYQVVGNYKGEYTTVSYGNVIYWIGNGYGALFAHLQTFDGYSLKVPGVQNKGSTQSVVKGRQFIFSGSRKVKAGQKIGTVGSVGNSDTPHLHLELYKNPKYSLQEQDYIIGSPFMKGERQEVNDYFNK